ncbi:MAG: KH domain-containing protein [Campylobacterales bacterium]
MVEEFVEHFVRLIASCPDEVQVSRHQVDETLHEIVIVAHSEDVGKIIGREGKMISAIKTVISGCKAKDGISYRVVVRAHGE